MVMRRPKGGHEGAFDLTWSVKKADKALQQYLESAPSADKPIAVAISLRQPSQTAFLTPEQTVSVATHLIDDVCVKVGEKPENLNVFKNIASLVVAAKPQFIRALLAHKDVAHAMANEQLDIKN